MKSGEFPQTGPPQRMTGIAALFADERDKMEGIWVDRSPRLLSDPQKPGQRPRGLRVFLEACQKDYPALSKMKT